MSIINDAIKKARRDSGRDTKEVSIDSPKKDELRVKVSSEPPEAKWTTVIAVSLIISVSLLGSVILYRHISSFNTPYKEPPSSPPRIASSKKTPLFLSESHRPRPRSTIASIEDDITLNGIVYGPEDKWAIINDRIVREGDAVLNCKLTLIKKEFVKIKKADGEEITLNLR